MSVSDSVTTRAYKGLAWAWLKSELRLRLGDEAAASLLSGYYDRLSEEYRDRRRVAAAGELQKLSVQLEAARLDGRSADVRKLQAMIARREALLAG